MAILSSHASLKRVGPILCWLINTCYDPIHLTCGPKKLDVNGSSWTVIVFENFDLKKLARLSSQVSLKWVGPILCPLDSTCYKLAQPNFGRSFIYKLSLWSYTIIKKKKEVCNNIWLVQVVRLSFPLNKVLSSSFVDLKKKKERKLALRKFYPYNGLSRIESGNRWFRPKPKGYTSHLKHKTIDI